MVWHLKYGKQVLKHVKTMDMVAGRGAKPMQQKGSGRARQGSVRSPLNRGGGKSHGPVPRDLSIKMNKRLRLKSIKTVLSAKLFEDKLIMMNSADIPTHKTKYLHNILKEFKDKKVLFVVPHDVPDNFTRAVGNLEHRDYVCPQQLSTQHMMKNDYVVLTKAGLQELEIILESREANYNRNKKLPRPALPYDHLIKLKKPRRDIFKSVGEQVDQMEIPERLHIVNPALRSYLKEV